jgi:hypothetical protein
VESADPDNQDVATEDALEGAVDWQSFVPVDTADHLATMERAARDSGCGVPWQLLAAIARVESDFGRNMATSSAGAIGYGQFLPSSWETFGSDGNAYDYRDALPAIALYLCQSGLARDPRAALFAYNHADWYVDLVLELAVRYDRMAAGAPTPDVLGVGPAQPPPADGVRMRYPAGRDLRLQNRARTIANGTVRWLGVPWRGRAPGQPISPAALENTTVSMLRGAFGLVGDWPTNQDLNDAGAADRLGSLANAAWDAGLLAHSAPAPQWTIDDVRQSLDLGRPVVALVDGRGLPGHPPDEAASDQPVLLIGTTADGLVYNDPTFSSSLGYGLEISERDFLKLWDTPWKPRQALAFVARPRPPARGAHLHAAEPPEAIARLVPTATVTRPSMAAQDLSDPDTEVTERVAAAPAPPADASFETAITEAAQASGSDGPDLSWVVLVAAATTVGGAFSLRLWRARRTSQGAGLAAATPQPPGQRNPGVGPPGCRHGPPLHR